MTTGNVIVITGASSGFGALTARTLALAGHTVYAGMRETTGRNAPQARAAADFSAEHNAGLRAIASLWKCPTTARAFRPRLSRAFSIRSLQPSRQALARAWGFRLCMASCKSMAEK